MPQATKPTRDRTRTRTRVSGLLSSAPFTVSCLLRTEGGHKTDKQQEAVTREGRALPRVKRHLPLRTPLSHLHHGLHDPLLALEGLVSPPGHTYRWTPSGWRVWTPGSRARFSAGPRLPGLPLPDQQPLSLAGRKTKAWRERSELPRAAQPCLWRKTACGPNHVS